MAETSTQTDKNLARLTLRGEASANVKKLKARRLDGKTTAEAISEDVEKHFSLLREHLRYKRRELVVEKSETGGAIHTPDFQYEVALEADPADETALVWRREVSQIRDANLIKSPAFHAVFGETFDTLVFRFPKERDVAEIVDTIEDQEPPGVKVECPSDCAWCDISFVGRPGKIHVSSDRLEVRDPRVQHAGDLIDAFQKLKEFIDDLGPERSITPSHS